MNIEQIVLRHLALPLVQPFRTAHGETRVRETILVECHGPDGAVGYGESAPMSPPSYTEESVETAWPLLEGYLVPAALAAAWETPSELAEHFAHVPRNLAAKAGIECAVWDLWAKSRGLPLAAALGGEKPFVDVGIVVGIPGGDKGANAAIDALLGRVEEAVGAGHRRVKLKIRPGWDLEPVGAVRSAFPNAPLAVDANGSYDPGQLETLRALDRFELGFIEQPFDADDLHSHAALQRRLATPVCLDESIVTLAGAKQALELGACRIVNVKPGRVGGISAAVEIHDACRSRGVPVWCGGLLESGVGRAHALAVASLPNFSLPADLAPPQYYLAGDVLRTGFAFASPGSLALPPGAGIGVEVDPARLEAHTVRIARRYR